MTDGRKSLEDLAATLDSLLRTRYASDDERPAREALIASYLGNETRKLRPDISRTRNLNEAIEAAAGLPPDVIESIRCRCLFYGCDDLVGLLVYKRVRADAIAREEAVLYVQDRLQRDDFRRIRNFEAGRGATFVTYIWQVVNNLLLDFGRVHSKRPLHVRQGQKSSADEFADDEVAEIPSEFSTDEAVGTRQLHEMLRATMSEGRADHLSTPGALTAMREKLRAHLNLSSKEKVFLKALFQYDMSIGEIRELPGFEMTVNEAYRFYYRIMDRLLESFKSAGVLDTMRAEVSATAPRVSVEIDGSKTTIAVSFIQYLEQLDRASTSCHAEWQGAARVGVIRESFSKLTKRLAAHFTPISSTVACSDALLSKAGNWSQEGLLTISGIDKSFRIGKRQWVALKGRFAGKSSG